MKKFIVLYMAPIADIDKMRKSATPEQDEEMKKSWTEWMTKNKESFVDVGTMAGKNKRVTKNGVQDIRNEVTGYSIVQAETHEDAAKLFEDNPMLQMPTAYVEVLEYVEMQGM